jgi:putative tricarboxylic transport membrane protein
MNFRDRWTGLFWLGISIFVCVKAFGMDIGTFHSPGPGFLPFWSGVILGLFSILLVATSLMKPLGKGEGKHLWKGKDWSKVIIVLTSLFIYAVLLQRLGYLLATFGLMTLMFGIRGKGKLWIRVVTAAFTAFATYIIFYRWLGVQLPKGIVGYE